MTDVHSWIVLGLLALFAPVFARTYLVHLGRDVRLWLISAFLVGACTMFGGTYGALMNLYLLALGHGPETIGKLNGGFYVGMALLAAISGFLVRALGGIRNSAAVGMAMTALGQVLFPLPTLLGSVPSEGWLTATLMFTSGGITLYAVNIWPFMASRIAAGKREYGFAGHLGLVPVGGMLGTQLSGVIAASLSATPAVDARAYALTLAGSGVLMLGAVAALLAIPVHVPTAAVSAGASRSKALGPAPVAVIAMMAVVMIFDVSGEGIGRVFQNVYMATDLKLGTQEVTMLLAYGQLVAALAVFTTPMLVARMGLAWTFIVTTLGMSIGLWLVSGIPEALAAGAGYALLIGFSQMARAAKTQFAMEAVEEHYRPHISGFMQFAETGTVFTLSVLGGHALQHWGLGFAGLFNLVACSTACAALLFWLLFVRGAKRALASALSSAQLSR